VPPSIDMPTVREALVARLAELRNSSPMTAEDRKPVVLDQSSIGSLSRIGPFLYYPGRRPLPAPLRAFVDFIKT
jgi:hypothetical protein